MAEPLQPSHPAQQIVRFGPADGEALARTLADAFLYGPVPYWLIPGHDLRHQVFVRYFRLLADHLLATGLVYGTPDMSGVACWMDHLDRIGPPGIADLDRKLYEACGQEYVIRFSALHELFDRVHPHERGHWYLMLLGVRNTWQGKGIGTALLEHHHRVLDEHGQAAFLEASSPENRRLYLRCGYTDLGPQPLPEGGPDIWPMWRDPQPRDPIPG